MDLDDLMTPQAALLLDVVRAFARAIRAMGYYDATHPVFESTRREAHQALMRAFELEDSVTLGCGGRHLVVDREGFSLDDPPSRALAERMFERSVVAVRIDEHVDEPSLSALMRALAEKEDRIRHAGGVAALLQQENAVGVRAVEVDFATLFASDTADLAPLVGGDPVALVALEEVLRFEREGGAVGDQLAVSLEHLGSVESLGAFLDDLLDSGESGTVVGGDGAGGAFGLITGDDLADYAAQAYLRNQGALRRGTNVEEIGQSADLLAGALVRLAPDARFALLRRLAGGEDPGSPEQEAAVAELAGRVDDRMLVATMASALLKDGGDSEAVRAIGNVLRRLRPVESERRKLLDQIDGSLEKKGKRIDGVLWQEMQSRAFDDRALGMLQMNVAESKEELAQYAVARMRDQLSKVDGQDILHTRADAVEETFAMRVLIAVLDEPGALSEAFVLRCTAMLDRLDAQGANDDCLKLLLAMMKRADGERAEALEDHVRGILGTERGRKWSMQLLERNSGQSRMMGELLLSALEGATDRRLQEALIDRLGQFDPGTLYRLGSERIANVDPLRVNHILRAALKANAATAVKLAKITMKNGAVRAKEVAVKTLVDCKEREALALLAHAAGWKGEKYAIQLFHLESADDRRYLHKLRMAAVGALGLTHSQLAVKPLVELLMETHLIESKEHEELRLGCAQALLTNGTPRAVKALEELTSHKKRAIREICERVLDGRRTR
ncbi:MAG: hypothetical protein RIT81_33200 [Deltaproteobacteria bacterium]